MKNLSENHMERILSEAHRLFDLGSAEDYERTLTNALESAMLEACSDVHSEGHTLGKFYFLKQHLVDRLRKIEAILEESKKAVAA